jgi:multisubunit Na+/H+ antiporter MnhG subunit
MSDTQKKPLWRRLSGPVKIGLAFALLGVILATIGMLRGFAPLTLRAFVVAIVISGVTWGVVSWAIAAAAAEVERDERQPES